MFAEPLSFLSIEALQRLAHVVLFASHVWSETSQYSSTWQLWYCELAVFKRACLSSNMFQMGSLRLLETETPSFYKVPD